MIAQEIQYPPKLEEAFRLLKTGRHICRDDGHVFGDLKQHREMYSQLFSALGFELCYHNRDFFYFKGDNRFRTKGLEQVTLFVLILFQYLEDTKFQSDNHRQWQSTLLGKLFKINELPHFATNARRRMMQDAGVNKDNFRKQVIDTLKRLGMIEMLDQNIFQFRSPVYRFIDMCIEFSEREEMTPESLGSSTSKQASEAEDVQ